MNIKILLAITLLSLNFSSCRNQLQEYNFDFEEAPANLNGRPNQWGVKHCDPNFSITTDYFTYYNGKASARLSYDRYDPSNAYELLLRRIPVDTSGSILELKAFLKLDRTSQAGLILETEDENGISIDWDTLMYNEGYRFTREWDEYSVTIPISKQAKTILIGVYLFGNGILWVDDIRLYMDGKPYFFDNACNVTHNIDDNYE